MMNPDFRRSSAAAIAKALRTGADLGIQDLQAALANIARRVAIMERDWNEVGKAFDAFDDRFQRFLQNSEGRPDRERQS